jgi:hypothetical protein
VPINRLPNEILSEIFLFGMNEERAEQEMREEWAVEDEGESEDESEEESNSPPFLEAVLSVCQHWRNIALNTAPLWTTIDFSGENVVEMTKVLIERSKSSPLHLVLDLTVGDEEEFVENEEDEVRRAFDLVKDQFYRCASLHIEATEEKSFDYVLQWLDKAEKLPPLKRLSICNPDGADLFTPKAVQDVERAMQLMHQIQHLTLKGHHLHWDTPFYTGLRTLRLSQLSEETRPNDIQFNRILEGCPQLAILDLEDVTMGVELTAEMLRNKVPIQLNHLRILKLQLYDENTFDYVVSSIAAPSLEFLSIRPPADEDSDEEDEANNPDSSKPGFDAILRFLVRRATNQSTLTRFYLESYFPSRLLPPILDQIPNVRHLRLEAQIVGDPVFNLIGDQLVELRTLAITDESEDMPPEALLGMAKKFVDRGRPLTQLDVPTGHLGTNTKETMTKLKELVRKVVEV